jgi:hypothetical protein
MNIYTMTHYVIYQNHTSNKNVLHAKEKEMHISTACVNVIMMKNISLLDAD